MIATLKALVEHLRERRNSIVRTVTVSSTTFDPTFGPQDWNEGIDVIDFDCLLNEIDEFADTFKEP